MGVKGTMAETRARRMESLKQAIEIERLARKRKQREHRLKWRKEYYQKKKLQVAAVAE